MSAACGCWVVVGKVLPHAGHCCFDAEASHDCHDMEGFARRFEALGVGRSHCEAAAERMGP